MHGTDGTIAWTRFPWATRPLRARLEGLVRRTTTREAGGLARRNPSSVYQPGTVLFYRGHAPLGGFLLTRGRLAFEAGHGSRAARGIEVEAPAVIGGSAKAIPARWPVTARAVTVAHVTYLPHATCPRSGRRGAARHGAGAHSARA